MIVYFSVDKDGYLDGWGSTRSSEDDVKMEIDKENEFFKSDFQCWKCIDGNLIFDEEKKQQLINQTSIMPSDKERLEALEQAMLEIVMGGM